MRIQQPLKKFDFTDRITGPQVFGG